MVEHKTTGGGEMLFVNAILFCGLVICALGWITRYISNMALIYYIALKNYKLPSDEDMKACSAEVVKRLFIR